MIGKLYHYLRIKVERFYFFVAISIAFLIVIVSFGFICSDEGDEEGLPQEEESFYERGEGEADVAPLAGEVPVESKEVASSINPTVSSDFGESVEFLYSGEPKIQHGVKKETIVRRAVTVMRGEVRSEDGGGLSGVTVHILDHPEYGYTYTQASGRFDLVVNRGTYTVVFEKIGYMKEYRRANANRIRDFSLQKPDVVLTKLSDKEEKIILGKTKSLFINDKNISGIVLFEPGTQAKLISGLDDKGKSIQEFRVRVTPITHEDGYRLPLPRLSKHVVGIDVSVAEVTEEKAARLAFTKNVILYIENTWGFPEGAAVPIGYVDPFTRSWKGIENGKVVKADLRDVLKKGTTYFKIALPYFGSYSIAFPTKTGTSLDYGYLEQQSQSQESDTADVIKSLEDPDCTCVRGGLCMCLPQRTTMFSLGVLAGPSLVYTSDGQIGFNKNYTGSTGVGKGTLPTDGLEDINIDYYVQGFEKTINVKSTSELPEKPRALVFSTRDAYGRSLVGTQRGYVEKTYRYKTQYAKPYKAAISFAQAGDSDDSIGYPETQAITSFPESMEVTYRNDKDRYGLGGMRLSGLHFYDTESKVLEFGDGTRRKFPQTIETVAGTGNSDGGDVCNSGYHPAEGDGKRATDANIGRPGSITMDSQGNLYIADVAQSRIRRVDVISGIITTIGGNGTGSAYSSYASCDPETGECSTAKNLPGEGSTATSVSMSPTSIGIYESNGSITVYYADPCLAVVRSFSVSADGKPGTIKTIAGTGYRGTNDYDGSGTSLRLSNPVYLTVDSSGTVYFTDQEVLFETVGNDLYDYRTIGPLIRSVHKGSLRTLVGCIEYPCEPIQETSAVVKDGSYTTYPGEIYGRSLKVDYCYDETGEWICDDTTHGTDNKLHSLAISNNGKLLFSYVVVDTQEEGKCPDEEEKCLQPVLFEYDVTDGMVYRFAGGIDCAAQYCRGTTCSAEYSTCKENTFYPQFVFQEAATDDLIVSQSTEGILSRVNTKGIVTRIAGFGDTKYCENSTDPCGDHGSVENALLGYPHSPAQALEDIDGTIYFSDSIINRIRKIQGSSIPFDGKQYMIPDESGSVVGIFDKDGRELEIKNALGKSMLTFQYKDYTVMNETAQEQTVQYLSTITDVSDYHPRIVLTVERDSDGTVQGITSEYGQETLVAIGSHGYIDGVTYPEGQTITPHLSENGIADSIDGWVSGETSTIELDQTTSQTNALTDPTGYTVRVTPIDESTYSVTSTATDTESESVTVEYTKGKEGQITRKISDDLLQLDTTCTESILDTECISSSRGVVTGKAHSFVDTHQYWGSLVKIPKKVTFSFYDHQTKKLVTKTVNIDDIQTFETDHDTGTINPFGLTKQEVTVSLEGDTKTYSCTYDKAKSTITCNNPGFDYPVTFTLDEQGRTTSIADDATPVSFGYYKDKLISMYHYDMGETYTYNELGEADGGFLKEVASTLLKKTITERNANGVATLYNFTPIGPASGEVDTPFPGMGRSDNAIKREVTSWLNGYQGTASYKAESSLVGGEQHTVTLPTSDAQKTIAKLYPGGIPYKLYRPNGESIEYGYENIEGSVVPKVITVSKGSYLYNGTIEFDYYEPEDEDDDNVNIGALKSVRFGINGANNGQTMTFMREWLPWTLRTDWKGVLTGSVTATVNKTDFKLDTIVINDTDSITYDYDPMTGVLNKADAVDILAEGYDHCDPANPSKNTNTSNKWKITKTSVGKVKTWYCYDPHTGLLKSVSATIEKNGKDTVVYTYAIAFRTTTRGIGQEKNTVSITDSNGNNKIQQSVASSYSYYSTGPLKQAWEQIQLDTTTTEGLIGYDDAGNTVSIGGSTVGSYDVTNKVESFKQYTDIEYYPGGEIKKKSETNGVNPTTYDYDAIGNLHAVHAGGKYITYDYDGAGNRIRRIEGNATTKYLYIQGGAPVAELDENNQIRKVFVFGSQPSTPDLVILKDTGRKLRLITDRRGSVRLAIDVDSGVVRQYFRYSPFGDLVQHVEWDQNFNEVCNNNCASYQWVQPFSYAGGMYDPDANIVQLASGDYDPSLRRFLSGAVAPVSNYEVRDQVNWDTDWGGIWSVTEMDRMGHYVGEFPNPITEVAILAAEPIAKMALGIARGAMVVGRVRQIGRITAGDSEVIATLGKGINNSRMPRLIENTFGKAGIRGTKGITVTLNKEGLNFGHHFGADSLLLGGSDSFTSVWMQTIKQHPGKWHVLLHGKKTGRFVVYFAQQTMFVSADELVQLMIHTGYAGEDVMLWACNSGTSGAAKSLLGSLRSFGFSNASLMAPMGAPTNFPLMEGDIWAGVPWTEILDW